MPRGWHRCHCRSLFVQQSLILRVEKSIQMLEEDIKYALGLNYQATATVNCWGTYGGPSRWLCRRGPARDHALSIPGDLMVPVG